MNFTSKKSRYYRYCLKTDSDRAVYDLILNGLENQERFVFIEAKRMALIKHSINELVSFVKLDNAELFYVKFEEYYIRNERFKKGMTLTFNYFYTPSEVKKYRQKIAERVNDILKSVTSPMHSLYERELALNDYLSKNVRYDESKKIPKESYSPIGALFIGVAVCEGYAEAFKLLCDAAEIRCLIVQGSSAKDGKTENHAWNIVSLDEKCYHVDVTWNSNKGLKFQPSRDYFNLRDSVIANDHSWDRTLVPVCDCDADNYYIKERHYFTREKDLVAYLCDGIIKGKRKFSVKVNHKFTDHEDIKGIFVKAINTLPIKSEFRCSYEFLYNEATSVIDVVFEML